MKKILAILSILMLVACSKVSNSPKTPNDILLAIKNYSCKMDITYYSNKNTTKYLALQEYLSSGSYSMEFLDQDNLKINYENSILKITSKLFETSMDYLNYEELNKNPLFLSYFINTYFNMENSDDINVSSNSINIILPNNNQYLYSAELTFENELPHSLTYFDENGNQKVNIIYSEFNFIA